MDGEESGLIVYGHEWCSLAMALRDELERHEVPFEWRDTQKEGEGTRRELSDLTGGPLSVPTVILPGGETMIEPHPDRVLERLGLRSPGLLERLRERLRL